MRVGETSHLICKRGEYVVGNVKWIVKRIVNDVMGNKNICVVGSCIYETGHRLACFSKLDPRKWRVEKVLLLLLT